MTPTIPPAVELDRLARALTDAYAASAVFGAAVCQAAPRELGFDNLAIVR